MVQAQNSFLIRKQTFIVKNNRPIDEVYIREKKVSLFDEILKWLICIHPLCFNSFIYFFKKLGQGTYGEVSAATHRENG